MKIYQKKNLFDLEMILRPLFFFIQQMQVY